MTMPGGWGGDGMPWCRSWRSSCPIGSSGPDVWAARAGTTLSTAYPPSPRRVAPAASDSSRTRTHYTSFRSIQVDQLIESYRGSYKWSEAEEVAPHCLVLDSSRPVQENVDVAVKFLEEHATRCQLGPERLA